MGARSVWAWWLVTGRETRTWAWDDELAAEKGQPVARRAARRKIWFARATASIVVVAFFVAFGLPNHRGWSWSSISNLAGLVVFFLLISIPAALVGYLAGAAIIDVAERLGRWFSGR